MYTIQQIELRQIIKNAIYKKIKTVNFWQKVSNAYIGFSKETECHTKKHRKNDANEERT